MKYKTATLLAVGFILALTAVVISFKIAKWGPGRNNPAGTQSRQSVGKIKPAGAGQSGTQSEDSDVRAIESDLNSVSDEDFGDANLSDQAIGL